MKPNNRRNGKRPKTENHSAKMKRTGSNKATTTDEVSGMKRQCKYDDIKTNHISWYDKAGYLFNEAVRVPFDAISGAPRNYGDTYTGSDSRHRTLVRNNNAVGEGYIQGIASPGIMTIEYHPTIGYADGVNSPINRAFTTMYGDIASKTTGAMQFQQADLAFFNSSLASTAAIIGACKRCLEVATLYSPMNYYYPVDLLTAILGTQDDAMDVIDNRDLYRARINDLIFQFNSLRIPAFVSIYERQYSIAHNVYADEDSVQAQLYVFKPLGYYVYDDTSATMKYTLIVGVEGVTALQNLINCAQAALSAWRNSSALPLISGALQRAYPDNEFISLDMLTVDSVNVPIFDRNILWQVNNARTIRINTASLDITQDVVNDFLVCKPTVDISNDAYKRDFWRSWIYLNSYDHNESPEFIMEATRLIPALNAEVISEGNQGILRTGSTELIDHFTCYIRIRDEQGVEKLTSQIIYTNGYIFKDGDVSAHVYHAVAAQTLSMWRNAPRMDLWYDNGVDDPFYVGPFGDLADYTYLYPNQLDSLHEAALVSLYWVGSMNIRV